MIAFRILLFGTCCVVCSISRAEDAAKDHSTVIATVGDIRITETEKDELAGRILAALFEDYAAERKITVSSDEIGLFLKQLEAGKNQERDRVAKRKAVLEEELKSGNLSEEDRTGKSAELAALREISDAPTEALTEEEKKQVAEMEEGMARSLIRAWKINKALFDQYGGRVIYQQMGPEPLDAYRRFLEDRLQAGAFKLSDRKYEADLWKTYTDDQLHDFVPEEKRPSLIQTPPWEIKAGEQSP